MLLANSCSHSPLVAPTTHVQMSQVCVPIIYGFLLDYTCKDTKIVKRAHEKMIVKHEKLLIWLLEN